MQSGNRRIARAHGAEKGSLMETVSDVRGEKLREVLEAAMTKLEGQAFFTAVMTDTYIEEEGEYVEDSD